MAYQPESETWTEKAPLPKASAFIFPCVLNDKIYIFGGGDENLASYSYRSVQVFYVQSNRWETKKDMETGRMATGVCAVEGKIFMIGGITDGLKV
jgi:N-acetylneuraminic acid mutarotase